MIKLIYFCVYFVVLSSLQVESLYEGERCTVEGRSGICIVLKKCDHMIQMMEKEGFPISTFLYDKLHSLACGFNYNAPMICCTSPENTESVNNHPKPSQGYDTSNTYNTIDPYQIWGFSGNIDSVESSESYNKMGTNVDVLPNIQNHPNLKLLPTDICSNVDAERVLGGTRAALYEMPWMVVLSYQTGRELEQKCGGTLITEYYVLTAAHCVTSLPRGTKLQSVVLGEHDVTNDPDCVLSINDKKFCAPNIINAKIDSIIPHAGYTSKTQSDDIALIRLSDPVDFSSASTKPICLPSTPELQKELLLNKNAEVAGWGLTTERIESTVLLKATLPVRNNDVCQEAYKKSLSVTYKQICAGGEEGIDSCSGDSGGPLTFPGILGTHGERQIQRGITSFGSLRCGVKDSPSVYTNIAYYMDWILDNISN